METATMGKVRVTARVENIYDLHEVSLGIRAADAVRHVEVTDALVDTGASILSLPRRLVAQLGLKPLRTRQARTSAGPTTFQVYGTVRLTIQGRDCSCVAVEMPDDCPVLIGQVPLELLDFVVDPSGQHLIGNPPHGGDHFLLRPDMYQPLAEQELDNGSWCAEELDLLREEAAGALDNYKKDACR